MNHFFNIELEKNPFNQKFIVFISMNIKELIESFSSLTLLLIYASID